MPFNNPRTYDYLLEGIAWSLTAQELERLETFARAHFTGAALKDLQMAIGRRQAALRTSRQQKSEAPSRIHHLRDPLERMMDEIAGATSVAEVDHFKREVEALFAGHPRRGELEQVLDARRRLLGRAVGT